MVEANVSAHMTPGWHNVQYVVGMHVASYEPYRHKGAGASMAFLDGSARFAPWPHRTQWTDPAWETGK